MLDVSGVDDAFGTYVDDGIENVRKGLIYTLSYIGQGALAKARNGQRAGTFMDQTGNLRSSIGACVSVDGRSMETLPFETVGGGSDGKAKGEAFLQDEVRKSAGDPDMIFLHITAGMEYAQSVESGHHVSSVLGESRYVSPRLVISDVCLEAEKEVEDMIPSLGLTLT